MGEVNWKDSYEAARVELKRAETLLKERHVNTKKVLVKQKKLGEELAKEKEKRRDAEKRSAASTRENARLVGTVQSLQERVELLEKTVAQLQSSVHVLLSNKNGARNVSEQYTTAQAKRGRVPSNHREPGTSRPNKKPAVRVHEEKNNGNAHTRKKDNTRDTQHDDTDDVSGNQQSVLDYERLPRQGADTQITDILTHLMTEPRLTKNKIKTAVHIASSMKETWTDTKIAVSVLYKMFECCRPTYVEQRAPIQWAPGNWFIMTNNDEIKSLIEYYSKEDVCSLVCMWCDAAALERNTIPWLLYYIHLLDTRAPHAKLMETLGYRSKDVVLKYFDRGHSNGIFSITEMCCATTVALAAFRYQGSIDAAAAFFIETAEHDIDHKYSAMEQLQIVCLGLALEVWPQILRASAIPSHVHANLWSITERYITPTVPDHPSRPIYYSICYYAANLIRKTMGFLLRTDSLAEAKT
mmetsp:Transcript_10581/g.20918  ORF Transcript_10581/g.20918 Transcript_10581/m.20918 type:complete len:468 (+) Transcript_10581:55-1458(+)